MPDRKSPMTKSPLIFFILVFALSIPFYLLGISGARLPGLSILPASALMAFMPMCAALILVYRQRGIDGINALLTHAFDFRTHNGMVWILVALLFIPVACTVEFLVLWLIGIDIPLPEIEPGPATFIFIAFFIGAIGEELGWQGYAYPALRTKHSTLIAALILGVIWALWHVIPFFQLGRSPYWIFWHSLSAVALRIIIVWLYENTRHSVYIAVLFHTMINVSWALFPISGSYYDPFITFLILTFAVGLIGFFYGPKTLKQVAPSA